MRLKVWQTLVSLFFLVSCNNSTNKAPDKKLQAEHEAKHALWEVMPEPYEKTMPDSLKKWIPVFRKVLKDDQRFRIVGYNRQHDSLKIQQKLDVENLALVSDFIDHYGWPVHKENGLIATRAVFMVIQHASLEIQEKYYDLLAKATDRDELQMGSLIMLEDRINMKRKRFQYFGSQLINYKGNMVLYPVVNIDSLDIWRKNANLLPITNYMALMGVTWDVKKYKKLLPELINYLNITNEAGIHYNKNTP